MGLLLVADRLPLDRLISFAGKATEGRINELSPAVRYQHLVRAMGFEKQPWCQHGCDSHRATRPEANSLHGGGFSFVQLGLPAFC